MPRFLSHIGRFFVRHWLQFAGLMLLTGVVIAVVLVPPLQARAHEVWHQALVWSGLVETAAATGQVYWCPMHPQIKRTRPNEVCPICSMALVPLEGGNAEPPAQLTLTARQVQQAGVAWEPVVRRTLYREIDTTGRIEHDERRLAKITSWVQGSSRIVALHVDFTGEQVTEGELMAELFSRELITTQESHLILAKNPRLSGEETLRQSRQRLIDQGLTREQVDQLEKTRKVLDRIPIYAPMSGTVIDRQVQQ
ncbi:MAG: efflux RND transporter periplasmic adaptor subunit, partial [Planctomycetaceae bacterium]